MYKPVAKIGNEQTDFKLVFRNKNSHGAKVQLIINY